jgi:hypothetical protein
MTGTAVLAMPAVLAMLAEGLEFFPIWCAKIPDLVGQAGGATNGIGD